MIALLIQVLILCLVFGALWYIISILPLPSPFGTVAQVIIGVVFAVALLYILLGIVGGGYSLGRL